MDLNVLTQRALREIYIHACRAYPRECCGFVLADATVKEGTNIQDELHAADPHRYQRTAANGYTFSVADTVFLNRSFKTPNPVAVIYHSHPDVGAYFSHEDVDKALYAGEPLLPVDYLVVDYARLDFVTSEPLSPSLPGPKGPMKRYWRGSAIT